MQFKDLQVGDRFRFSSEENPKSMWFNTGPWIKRSRRSFSHAERGPEHIHRIGHAGVEVRKLPPGSEDFPASNASRRRAEMKASGNRQSAVNAARRVAMTLMRRGMLGDELLAGILREGEGIGGGISQPEAREAIRRAGADYGVVGQSLHDPNAFASCEKAAAAKSKHPNREFMVLTKKTPYCEGCSLRNGSHCGLMGGRLVTNASESTEADAFRVASLLVSEGEIDSSAANFIAESESAPSVRIAALHLARSAEPVEISEIVKAEAASRRIAAILEPKGEIDLSPRGGRNPWTRAANADLEDMDGIAGSGADPAAEAASMAYSGMLDSPPQSFSPGMPIARRRETDYVPPAFDIPKRVGPRGSRVATASDFADDAARAMRKALRMASRDFAAGRMTLERAEAYVGRREEMEGLGAKVPRDLVGISRQLDTIVGSPGLA
jgi:hypothetical protein